MKDASLLLFAGLLLLFSGCAREPAGDPVISTVDATACKNGLLKAFQDHPSDQDCIVYRWSEGDTLRIKHVNAGFNCCPQGFQTSLRVAGDTLVITEKENSSLCDCNCLFDLNYFVTGIEKDDWWIRVEEPYVGGDAEKILFKVELKKASEGEHCLTRTGYPWRL
jgi:hypothetical protein